MFVESDLPGEHSPTAIDSNHSTDVVPLKGEEVLRRLFIDEAVDVADPPEDELLARNERTARLDESAEVFFGVGFE